MLDVVVLLILGMMIGQCVIVLVWVVVGDVYDIGMFGCVLFEMGCGKIVFLLVVLIECYVFDDVSELVEVYFDIFVGDLQICCVMGDIFLLDSQVQVECIECVVCVLCVLLFEIV